MNKEKVYVYIGRFQVPHNGHLATMVKALEKCDHLIVAVGSYQQARNPKNPFKFDEIKNIIEEMLEKNKQDFQTLGVNKKISVVPIHDHMYNNQKWLLGVQEQVASKTTSLDITLTGFNKDSSSAYLNFFPQWKQDLMTDHVAGIDATTVRNSFFGSGVIEEKMLPDASVKFLKVFKEYKTKIYDLLCGEHNAIVDYKEQHKDVPWRTPFLTGDSVVTCAGHVLLVKRKNFPGKGLWALPGGFFKNIEDDQGPVDYDQTDTAIRELREETRLKVPEPVLRGCIRDAKSFSDPKRSLRWRIMTTAVYVVLNDTVLPKVKGSDDAEKAFWVPINEVKNNREKFFEDHLAIIDTFLGVL